MNIFKVIFFAREIFISFASYVHARIIFKAHGFRIENPLIISFKFKFNEMKNASFLPAENEITFYILNCLTRTYREALTTWLHEFTHAYHYQIDNVLWKAWDERAIEKKCGKCGGSLEIYAGGLYVCTCKCGATYFFHEIIAVKVSGELAKGIDGPAVKYLKERGWK